MIKRSFPPVAGPDTRVLVLGSLPGEVSLARSQYYAHPQNQFWRLIGEVTGTALSMMDYPARLAALGAAGIGLWDVIGAATRQGSLDGAIRHPEPNALAELVATQPRLRAVAYNGAKASAIGRRRLEHRADLEQVTLPSSSPAYTLRFDDKAKAWRVMKGFLDLPPSPRAGFTSLRGRPDA